MHSAEIPAIDPDEFSRCEDRSQVTDYRSSLSPTQKADAAITVHIERALWNDDVLRAIESSEIAVQVRNGIVYLSGHIVGTTSQSRIKKALQAIPGLLGVQNNLVLDDRLTLEVAGSLGTLEHTHGCKFFTGASHGVVSLNGMVSDENVKLLAEKHVSANPNVRAVLNNVRVSGVERDVQDQTFLQPTIGQIIYFLDGIRGVVMQVIIDPNNRRVVAMILRGQFAKQPQELISTNSGQARSPEHLVVVPLDAVRYLNRASGFLHINSHERERYTDFDSSHFSPPKADWKAPFPYCPDDVLFPAEKQEAEYQIMEQLLQSPSTVASNEQLLWEQLLANENLGG